MREKREGGAWSRALVPSPFPFERLSRRLKKERDAGVDDDGSVAVVSTAFTLL